MTIYRDDLERVYALIEKPENWTQGAFAKDAAGEPICDEGGNEIEEPFIAANDEAACWCLWGAAYKCGIRERQEYEFVTALGFKYTSDPSDFNDTHTHAEVLDLLRAAIARAPERPQRGEGE